MSRASRRAIARCQELLEVDVKIVHPGREGRLSTRLEVRDLRDLLLAPAKTSPISANARSIPSCLQVSGGSCARSDAATHLRLSRLNARTEPMSLNLLRTVGFGSVSMGLNCTGEVSGRQLVRFLIIVVDTPEATSRADPFMNCTALLPPGSWTRGWESLPDGGGENSKGSVVRSIDMADCGFTAKKVPRIFWREVVSKKRLLIRITYASVNYG